MTHTYDLFFFLFFNSELHFHNGAFFFATIPLEYRQTNGKNFRRSFQGKKPLTQMPANFGFFEASHHEKKKAHTISTFFSIFDTFRIFFFNVF